MELFPLPLASCDYYLISPVLLGAYGDFNGDGNVYIAIANTEVPLITILLGDGKLDVVTDDWGRNHVRLLAGDGAGNLIGPGKPFATGKRPYRRVRTADFNRDGKPDW